MENKITVNGNNGNNKISVSGSQENQNINVDTNRNSISINAINNNALFYSDQAKEYAEQSKESAEKSEESAKQSQNALSEIKNNEDLKKVSANEENINKVADDIENVNFVGENIEDITELVTSLENLGDTTNINIVASNIDNINSLAEDIQTVEENKNIVLSQVAVAVEQANKSTENATISTEKAEISINQANISTQKALESKTFSENALIYSTNAKTSENNARDYSETALQQSTIATTQANISITQANNALNYSKNAKTSEENALIYSNNAKLNADTSLENANISEVNSINAEIWAEGTDEEVQALGGVHSAKKWTEINSTTSNLRWGKITGSIGQQADLMQYLNTFESAINDTSEDLSDIYNYIVDVDKNKQDKLTAGENITIEDGVISAVGGSSPDIDTSNLVTKDGTETISGAKTLTQPLTIQNGAGTGSLIVGGDVNAGTVTNGTRKLARVAVPTQNNKNLNAVLLGFDSNGDDALHVKNRTYDAVSFGGQTKITNATSPMSIGFCVAKTRNGTSANDKVYPLEMDSTEARFNVKPNYNGVELATKNDLDEKPSVDSVNNLFLMLDEQITSGLAEKQDKGNYLTPQSLISYPTFGDLKNYVTTEQAEAVLQTKQDVLTAGENIEIVDNVISAKGGGSGFNLFDTKTSDHILDGDELKGWALQGTYVYKNAIAGSRDGYPDFYNKVIEEYNEATLTETVNGVTVKVNSNGHKFYDIADKTIIDELFNNTGLAWFYGIDTENERVFLPRNAWFEQMTADTLEVGDSVEAGLPNITGLLKIAINEYSVSGAFTASAGGGKDSANGDDSQSTNFNFDASLSNPIYGNSDTVQTNAVKKLLYICVGNTNVETAVTEVVDVTTTENDTIPLFTGQYFDFTPNNVSWLKAGQQTNSGTIYTTAYNELVNCLNGVNKYNLKVIDTADMLADVDYSEYWKVNQDEMYFITPTKLSYGAFSNVAPVVGNGYALELVNSDGTKVYPMGRTGSSNYYGGFTATATTVPQELTNSNPETTVVGGYLGVTTNETTSGIEAHLKQSEAQLYFKVANAVQNLELLNVGEITESLAGKVDINSNVIDGQWVASELELSTATAIGTYEIDLSSYLPNDLYNYEVLVSHYQTSSASTGSITNIWTDYLPNPISYTLTSTSTVNSGNTFIAVIGGGRTISKDISSATSTKNILKAHAYRRIGTNV